MFAVGNDQRVKKTLTICSLLFLVSIYLFNTVAIDRYSKARIK